ncbi:MAG: Hint domain-containing protein [Yoonia sp.]|uniref:Hint domain-containing protein n=1 Tax=Yoonia sp. TaxID=2212373 RepID=UPI003EF28B8C
MCACPLTIDVYHAQDFVACDGVTKGEPLSFADELILDDVFQLGLGSDILTIDLATEGDALHRADAPQNAVHLDCCLTFMAPDGDTHEAIVLVEVAQDAVTAIYLLPLGELLCAVDYRLVSIERHTATKRFAEAAIGSFARGTHITMADGAQRPIEDIRAGDLVLTRDAGRQPVLFVGQSTLRAAGSFAPVVIAKGVLHNVADLVLRPDHRLFVYQREDTLGAGRPEVLIKARHLVDDKTVRRRRGGFVDYYQLVFAAHHIIYAEGIAAESQLVDTRTRAALPEETPQLEHDTAYHTDYEVAQNLIPFAHAAALLRKASSH